jgi:hypothetical protein
LYVLTGICQLINEEEIIEDSHHDFAATNGFRL